MDQHLIRTLTKIFLTGLKAVDPEAAVHRHVDLAGDRLRVGEHVYPLDSFRRIIVTGAGKGTAPMARALEDILGERLTTGWIIVKYGHGLPLKKIAVFEAGHPVPDQAGLDATRLILGELAKCTADDLVLGAFSGGGSALTPAPRPPVSFAEKQQTTQLLLDSGAAIGELNTLRKHLSTIKGGQLAQIAYPATVAALFLSDVVGDPLDVIASGPTVPDPGTFADCLGIINRYGLDDVLPAAVVRLLRDGAGGIIPDTPKAGDPVFRRVQNLVVGSNRAALLAADAGGQAAGLQRPHPVIFFAGGSERGRRGPGGHRQGDRHVGQPHPGACLCPGGGRNYREDQGRGQGRPQSGTGPGGSPRAGGLAAHCSAQRRHRRHGRAHRRGRRHGGRGYLPPGPAAGVKSRGLPGGQRFVPILRSAGGVIQNRAHPHQCHGSHVPPGG